MKAAFAKDGTFQIQTAPRTQSSSQVGEEDLKPSWLEAESKFCETGADIAPLRRKTSGKCELLAMRLTIAFVNLVSNTVPNLKPAARASLGG